MGGFFGVCGQEDRILDLFYGTDYHSHLGTRRGGMAVVHPRDGLVRVIHNIENAQFRSKFEDELPGMRSPMGLGVISDTEDQPILMRSHLGDYAIVTVGRIHNLPELSRQVLNRRGCHFSELKGHDINPTELVATLINREKTIEEGIRRVQDTVQGSCSLLVLTPEGIYAARDKWGRTPVVIGRREGGYAVTMETAAFPNLDYETDRYLGPGEIRLVTPEGHRQLAAPGLRMQICAFLWVYYGFPSSCYEGINVEKARNRCGAYLARRNPLEVDLVSGIPDSGIAHGIGYAGEAGIPYQRPFIKYTPTWARSFMPQNQDTRDLVARMKLIPVTRLIRNKRLLFCDDSIVRGTQLKDNIQRLYDTGAREVHMCIACPPLVYGCKFLNFSRSRSELDLAARRAIQQLEKRENPIPPSYTDPDSEDFRSMVAIIRRRLNLTSLHYQRLEDLIAAIGLPGEKLCTYCWSGSELSGI